MAIGEALSQTKDEQSTVWTNKLSSWNHVHVNFITQGQLLVETVGKVQSIKTRAQCSPFVQATIAELL